MSFKKMLSIICMVVVFIAASIALTSSSTLNASAATCKEKPNSTNCDNTDPASTGCADANTINLTTLVLNGISVQLRYSPTCQTAWAKVYGSSSAYAKGCVDRNPASMNLTLCENRKGQFYTSQVFIGKVTYSAAVGAGKGVNNVPFEWSKHYYSNKTIAP